MVVSHVAKKKAANMTITESLLYVATVSKTMHMTFSTHLNCFLIISTENLFYLYNLVTQKSNLIDTDSSKVATVL